MFLTPAYDHTGKARPLHRLAEDDVIEWKQNKSRGVVWARVTALLDGPDRRATIRIMPLDRELNMTGGRQKWISRNVVMRVYEPDGRTRKEPRPEDQCRQSG